MTTILDNTKTTTEFYTLFTTYQHSSEKDRAKKFYELLVYTANNLSTDTLLDIIQSEIEDPMAQAITLCSILKMEKKLN